MLDSLWLVHPDADMCAAFRGRFTGLPNVRVVLGPFEDLGPHDCFVTAGNAFGLMTAVLWTSNSARLMRLTGVFAGVLVALYITVEAPLSGFEAAE